MMTDEFSVFVFLPDGTHFREAEYVDAETAVRTARNLSLSLAALEGIIARIIITDGGDHTCFEWKHGQGVTFPTIATQDAQAHHNN